jgi:hypothetical protein
VILGIDGRAVTSPEDVLDASFFIAADDEVKLRVARGEQMLELTTTAADRPNSGLVHTGNGLPTLAPMEDTNLRGFGVKLDR